MVKIDPWRAEPEPHESLLEARPKAQLGQGGEQPQREDIRWVLQSTQYFSGETQASFHSICGTCCLWGFAFSVRALSFVSCTIFLFLVNKKKSILNMS